MKRILILLCVFCAAYVQLQAQDSAKSSIQSFVIGKRYSFEPINTTTGSGRLRQLTPGYFFQLKDDTLKVSLPYFGRAYTAPLDPSDAGYNFTTTDFTYDIKEGKKNSYIVSINAKGKVYNTNFMLTVYDNGSAYLQANSSDRQPVSYNGSVKEKN